MLKRFWLTFDLERGDEEYEIDLGLLESNIHGAIGYVVPGAVIDVRVHSSLEDLVQCKDCAELDEAEGMTS